MPVTVKIEALDDGTYAVGTDESMAEEVSELPPGAAPAADPSRGMQPVVKSIDEALNIARQLLTQGAEEEQGEAPNAPQAGAQENWDDEAMQRMQAKQLMGA